MMDKVDDNITVSIKTLELNLPSICWQKIMGWTKAASGEVSGLGLIEMEDGVLQVKEVFLLEQECNSMHTELDDGSVAKLIQWVHEQKKKASALRFWWHSHATMNTFWSGTDDATATKLVSSAGEWVCSMVVNKAGDALVRLDMVRPFHVTFDKLPWEVEQLIPENVYKRCAEEVKEKVKDAFPSFQVGNYFPGQNGFENRNGDSTIPMEEWMRRREMSQVLKDTDIPKSHPPFEDGGHASYWSEGSFMVWVDELHCFVPEQCACDKFFTYNGKRLSRADLRSVMMGDGKKNGKESKSHGAKK